MAFKGAKQHLHRRQVPVSPKIGKLAVNILAGSTLVTFIRALRGGANAHLPSHSLRHLHCVRRKCRGLPWHCPPGHA